MEVAAEDAPRPRLELPTRRLRHSEKLSPKNVVLRVFVRCVLVPEYYERSLESGRFSRRFDQKLRVVFQFKECRSSDRDLEKSLRMHYELEPFYGT